MCWAIMLGTAEKDYGNVMTALADPTRRKLLDHIAAKGEATATTLTTTVTVSRQAVVKHLVLLNNAGLVASAKVGREVRYKVCPDQLNSTAEWMKNIAMDWDRKLEWIKQAAENEADQ